MGIYFMVDLIVLKSCSIDVILGMNCLVKYDGMISCARRVVALRYVQKSVSSDQSWQLRSVAPKVWAKQPLLAKAGNLHQIGRAHV